MKKKSLLSRIWETIVKIYDVVNYGTKRWLRKEFRENVADDERIKDPVVALEISDLIHSTQSKAPQDPTILQKQLERGIEAALQKVQRAYPEFEFVCDPVTPSYRGAFKTVNRMVQCAALQSEDLEIYAPEYSEFRAVVIAEFQRVRTPGDASKKNQGQPS